MRVLRVLIALAILFSAGGCSQVTMVPKSDAAQARELKNATVRTRTGEVYYFDRAAVSADSLSGFAEETRTVYLTGGEMQEITQDRQVFLALDDVEQITVSKRDWTRAGLWALGIGAAVGVVAVVAAQNSPSDASGGGYAPPPKPPGL